MVAKQWDELNKRGIPDLADECPCAETVRKRINSLECYSTHASRYGRPSADKKFSPNGEPVPVEYPFERIFMDGTEYEHSVFYSEEFKIAAAKMKGVMPMDAFSQFVFPFPVFAGPYRPEMGLRALRSIMIPPPLSEEEIAEDPETSQFFGLPCDVMIDRDRTLIPPRLVPGAINLFSTAELAEAYHSDAKAKLENFHKFVKSELKMIGGRILGPRVKYELGYNPLAATEVTRAQYADLVEQCRRKWNASAKDSLGNRSPNDIMRAFIRTNGPRLTDPGEVWRALSSTPEKPCTLTVDGLTYDNVHYRWNREGIGTTLSSNYHNTPFAQRLKGTAKVLVTIRTWDDDIDIIEVFDEENSTYHRMYSTDPGYTGGLSRWEHHIYQEYLRSGGGGAKTKRDRLLDRAKHLEAMKAKLSGTAFRDLETPVGLLEGEERRLSGKRAENPGCADVPELHIPTDIGGTNRKDRPSPPPQKRSLDSDEDLAGRDDIRSDPSKAIAQNLGDDEPEASRKRSRWDFDDDDSDEDKE